MTASERSGKDFQVLQSYDELGEACELAVYDALCPPSSGLERQWAEAVARRARESFQGGLDGIEDPLADELRGELNRCTARAQEADNRYYELLGRTKEEAKAQAPKPHEQ